MGNINLLTLGKFIKMKAIGTIKCGLRVKHIQENAESISSEIKLL